jgi:succinate dehydrogenase / fumarate reductase membrane anchor subunit
MSGAVQHWWRMRLSSLLLVPLSLWLLWAGMSMAGAGYAQAVQFMAHPLNALAAVLLTVIGLYHTLLGITEIIEDYVPGAGLSSLLLWLTRLGCLAGLLAVLYAVYSLMSGA